MPFIKPRNQEPASSLAARARSASGKVRTSAAQHLKRFWNWLTRLRRWLSEPLPTAAWRTASGLALAALAAWFFASKLQDGIRFFGLFLQLLGVGTVAYGLRKTRELFGQPSLTEQITEWWQRRPKYAPKPQDIVLEAGVMPAPQLASFTFQEGVKPDTSVEGRLAALEKKYDALQKQLGEVHNRITTETSQLGAKTKAEQQERERRDREIEERLKELSTGGLSIEWTGLVWLYFGIACATIPDKMAESPWVCLGALLAAPLLAYFGLRELKRRTSEENTD